jgi:hypothetical protein
MDVVKVGWSGGKDSTCAAMLHIERGDYVKIVCYIPMFTDKIPLLTKRHYDFIHNTSEQFTKLGAEFLFAEGMTYWDFVTHIKTKGKDKGNIMGFPPPITKMCTFKCYSKTAACKKADKEIGYYDYESVGIAYDEYKRHGQLNEKKRSILVEKGYTESACARFCYSRKMLSPHYEYDVRDGCSLCPNARPYRRQIWYNDYPEAVPLLLELQNIVKQRNPKKYPLRGNQWFIDTDNPQLSFFG